MSKNTIILLAAGSSRRMQRTIEDKMLVPLAGRPLFIYSVSAFLESGVVTDFVIVYRDDVQQKQMEAALELHCPGAMSSFQWVQGGARRQDSVAKALEAVAPETVYIFIHDCARPLIRPESIQSLYQSVQKKGAATLAHPVVDTIHQVTAAGGIRPLARSKLWSIETPQAFESALLKAAYEKMSQKSTTLTDESTAVIRGGHAVALVHNPYPNTKVTHPWDLAQVQIMIEESQHVSL